MHAGRGITHSERPGKELAESGGENEFIQFWVNTPARFKMETPYYLPLSEQDTPKVLKDKAVIGVVAGEFEGVKGPARTYSPQTLLRLEARKGAKLSLEIPQEFNALIYLLDGEIDLGGNMATDKDMVWFENDPGNIVFEVNKDTRLILLSGAPIEEEVTAYGPFVMNTHTEVMEALRDAQMGKMGVLIEEF